MYYRKTNIYALNLQGHGESQSFGNLRSNFDCYNDLVDDVIQYMNQIQDEISNDNQTGYEFHNIKEKEDNINAREENDNNMVEYIVNDMDNSNYHAIEDMNNTHLIVNSNDYGSNSSCASTSDTANASTSDKDEGCYNYLDILKVAYLYLSEYFAKIYKHDKFLNDKGRKFKCISELIKATITLNSNVKKKELHSVDGMNHSTPKKPENKDILKKILNEFLI
ncbi:fam-a protein [Plasmodium yoelii]|uniref:Fam-a protein n=1 Tax=Plasmodium yoelii TaxID=5861 RepID=A0A078K8F6_PLAYE|nr:fam-a protein [Plasmodium yoelii]